MVGIPELDAREAPRARRWDALVLGSGVRALVAAARLGAGERRVLVVEESTRQVLPSALGEPFMLAGLRDRGVLDACLRLLGVPLIDQRRIEAERLAYQVVADPLRIDVGRPGTTAGELVDWGLCGPDEAHTLMRRLVEASEIERQLLLESPLVRTGRRLAVGRGGGVGHHRRGLPGEVAEAPPELRGLLRAQLEALHNLGAQMPPPEAQARLLGLALAGGAGFADEPPWLVDLLRKRVRAKYGDFRSVTGGFEIVSVAGQPGIRLERSGEIWLGRALVLAAAPSALRQVYVKRGDDRVPSILRPAESVRYRATLLFRARGSLVPEGMGGRLILPGSIGEQPAKPAPALAITAFPCQTARDQVDLVVRSRLRATEPTEIARESSALRDRVAEQLRSLMPFAGESIETVEFERPLWDSDDGWLEDPSAGEGWPSEADLRLSTRPPVYHLDRASVAGLGLEGDLLLGWRGGDAIANELG